MCGTPGVSPMHPAINLGPMHRFAPCHKSGTAVQSTSLWLPNKLFMTLASYNKITLHTVITWPPLTTLCFKIPNPIFVVSAMQDNIWFNAVCLDTANRFYSAVYDVINYSDVTSGGVGAPIVAAVFLCSLVFYEILLVLHVVAVWILFSAREV